MTKSLSAYLGIGFIILLDCLISVLDASALSSTITAAGIDKIAAREREALSIISVATVERASSCLNDAVLWHEDVAAISLTGPVASVYLGTSELLRVVASTIQSGSWPFL
jgi:hypothetical protein